MISAVLGGLAGIVEVSYLSSAIANQGLGKELSVIAAAVIGGTALTGGEGTVLGIFVGTVILEVLRNGLVLLGTDCLLAGHLRRRRHHPGRVHRPAAQGPVAALTAQPANHQQTSGRTS